MRVKINIVAVLLAAIASVVGSMIWYGLLGDQLVRLQTAWRGADPTPTGPWQLVVVFVSALIMAVCIDALLGWIRPGTVRRALLVAATLWLGFVLTQWISSIAGEDVPVGLAAIHAGDWLLHLVIITSILAAARRRTSAAG